MKKRYFYPFVFLFFLGWLGPGCSREEGSGFMKVTTKSTAAMDLYSDAYGIARGMVELDKAILMYREAIAVDPDFFMAHYQLATDYLFHGNVEAFEKSARSALASKYRLSRGEMLQRKALEAWLDDKDADVTTYGRQLAELYPEDPDAWITLGFFYYMNQNFGSAIASFEKAMALKNPDDRYCGPKLAIVPICMTGYAYLITNQAEKARASFDDYIQQYPDEQNPYDCMADYFMAVGEYDKAFDNYMTAFRMDTAHDVYRQRALNALMLLDGQAD
jgi:tetratricopeptide (TPR) repeat protein